MSACLFLVLTMGTSTDTVTQCCPLCPLLKKGTVPLQPCVFFGVSRHPLMCPSTVVCVPTLVTGSQVACTAVTLHITITLLSKPPQCTPTTQSPGEITATQHCVFCPCSHIRTYIPALCRNQLLVKVAQENSFTKVSVYGLCVQEVISS